jgi:hypothetical protein
VPLFLPFFALIPFTLGWYGQADDTVVGRRLTFAPSIMKPVLPSPRSIPGREWWDEGDIFFFPHPI